MASSSTSSRPAPHQLRRGSNRESVASSSSRNRSYSTRVAANSLPEGDPPRTSTRVSSRPAPPTEVRRSERSSVITKTTTSTRRSQDSAPTPRAMSRRPIAANYQQTPVGTLRVNAAFYICAHMSPRLVLPWNPEAYLIPPTSAPLGSRISVPPLSSALPSYKMPVPLNEMGPELQEASILEDLLFVFMVCFLHRRKFCADRAPGV